jgi:catechol 2,3-dioxygenase-like lactoylglutathione lyase family enzyme
VRSTGIHHIDLVVSDIQRSLGFYREILGPLGWHGVHEVEGERGETIHYVHGPGSTVGLRQAPDGAASLPVDRYRVGLHHVCFEASTREAVDETAERLRALGATVTDGPKEYPEYRAGYYAVFFRDPDGLKLELVCIPPRAYDWQKQE